MGGGTEHFFYIFGYHVHLDVDDAADLVHMHDGALPSVRGNPELELCGVCVDGRNGEGDAVYADAAFVYGVAQVFCGDADAHHVVLPHGGDGYYRAGGVYMAHDEVAAKAVAQLPKLQGCEIHSTQILHSGDESILRKLRMHLTCEPEFPARNIIY